MIQTFKKCSLAPVGQKVWFNVKIVFLKDLHSLFGNKETLNLSQIKTRFPSYNVESFEKLFISFQIQIFSNV